MGATYMEGERRGEEGEREGKQRRKLPGSCGDFGVRVTCKNGHCVGPCVLKCVCVLNFHKGISGLFFRQNIRDRLSRPFSGHSNIWCI